jgi:CheY-like chemotaxis protein
VLSADLGGQLRMTNRRTPPPVLVVADPDSELRDTVSGYMSARGYRVEPAAGVDEATDLLQSQHVDVLISDLAMRGHGGTDLLTVARISAPATRMIAMATDPTPRERDAALRLGALRVLAKPLSLLELADAINVASEVADGFYGWLHRMSLIDVLQMYHHAGESLVLNVTGEVEGAIALHRGQLVHAETAAAAGIAALVELLHATRGRLETTALTHTTQTIGGPFDHVLLDALRTMDEARGDFRAITAPAALDGWLDELTERDPLDRGALVAWLGEHAPGAGVWRLDLAAAELRRLDVLGEHPEIEMAGTPGSIGWAYELAELADPTWSRVELTCGSTAIALVRVPGIVLAFARLITGDAVHRRFQMESTQLVRWLAAHTGAPR